MKKQKAKDLLLALLLNLVSWYAFYVMVIPIFQKYLDVPVKVITITKEVKAQSLAPSDEPTLKEKIISAAVETGMTSSEALDIADCESTFNPLAKSKISTAKGLFQFLDGTWRDYCDGDVFNEDDNINCFMKFYPKHKTWWECSKMLGYTK